MFIPFLVLLPTLIFLAAGQHDVKTHHQAENTNATGEITEGHLRLYRKIHSFLIRTKEYKNFTFSDSVWHIRNDDSWIPPKELQEDFPYYLSGYDYDDQPVWMMEVGKFDVRKYVERGPEGVKNMTTYLFQAVHRVFKSMLDKDTPEREIQGAVVIGDWDGVGLAPAVHLPTISFLISMLRTYGDFVELILSRAVFFNMNISLPWFLTLSVRYWEVSLKGLTSLVRIRPNGWQIFREHYQQNPSHLGMEVKRTGNPCKSTVDSDSKNNFKLQ